MRLKKVFVGALAAAMLVCAVAVPAFAAEEVEQENCLSSSYVQMNIPYADFYKAAGVDNASEIDAVTSATKNKTRAGKLAAGSYHVNADGTDITGVSFPVKVLTPWALDSSKQVTDDTSYDITVKLRGKDTTTTYSGVNALFENDSYAYYKLSEAPAYYATAWYNVFTGSWEFGKVKATETTVNSATVELVTNGRHTDYEMKVNGFDLDVSTNKVYGVVMTTADGAEYGLHHVTNIWLGTELGFDADDAYYASMIGKTITQIAADLEKAKQHLHLVAAVDDLKYLRKGGRLSAAAAVAGGMLGIKPILAVIEGKVALAGKARGLPGVYVALFKKIDEMGGIHPGYTPLLGYTVNHRELQPLLTYLQDNLQCAEPLVRQIGCVIGTHAGPGAFGLAFFDQGLEL